MRCRAASGPGDATREPSDRRAKSRAVADRRNGPRPTAERSAQFFFQGQNLFLCVTELFFSKSRAPLLSVRDRPAGHPCALMCALRLACCAEVLARWTLDTATRRAARGRADRSRPVPLTAGAERRANLGPRGVQCARAAHACTQPTATTPHRTCRMARPRAASVLFTSHAHHFLFRSAGADDARPPVPGCGSLRRGLAAISLLTWLVTSVRTAVTSW